MLSASSDAVVQDTHGLQLLFVLGHGFPQFDARPPHLLLISASPPPHLRLVFAASAVASA